MHMKFSDQKSPEEDALENQLRALQPESLSDTALDSLNRRFEETAVNELPITAENVTQGQSGLTTMPRWRPVVWAVAAILMIGLWLVSVYLPDQSGGLSSKTPMPLANGGIQLQTDTPPEIQMATGETETVDKLMARSLRLTDVRDEGIVMSIGNIPMKRLRYEFIDTYTWATSQGSGQLRMEVPREDFVLVPVSTY